MTRADLVIVNASILTMDPDHPRAQALAVAGARILAIGTRAEIEPLAGPGTRRFDAQGCSVMPGMTEAHLHLFAGAYGLRLLHLDAVRGLPALREALQSCARARPDEGLLICKAADYNIFGDGVATTRQMLDQALPDRPAILFAGDHHTAWANTVALEKAGVLHGAPMPPGNEIVIGADGTATGELREFQAVAPVMALRTSGGRENLGLSGAEPEAGPSAGQRADDEAVMLDGLKYCASFGFTSLHNMDGNFYQLEVLRALEDRGQLLCRTQVPFHLTPSAPLSSLALATRMHEDYRSDRLRSGRIKMFMDGVIDSGTAVMIGGYGDNPAANGDPLHDAKRFAAACIEADRRGLQISVHAVGDGAVRRVLDGYAAARAANGARDSRHRIEHIELLHPDDLPRFADLGVIASMQPAHPPGAMDFPLLPWTERVGAARWSWSFPMRYLRDAGVPVAFASDWPVSDIDPMRSVKAAVMRRPWRDGDPSHASTLMQALHGYTAGGAHAGFDEGRLGRLIPGMLADIVVMDRDLEHLPSGDLDTARAALTVCGGQTTWEA